VLLLILAVAASGFLHVVDDSYASVTAAHSHDLVSVAHDLDGEPYHSDHDGKPHGTVCSTTSSCSLYMPVTLPTVLAPSNSEPAFVDPEAEHYGLAPTPHARPPHLFANV
jgi:hypothetical protein